MGDDHGRCDPHESKGECGGSHLPDAPVSIMQDITWACYIPHCQILNDISTFSPPQPSTVKLFRTTTEKQTRTATVIISDLLEVVTVNREEATCHRWGPTCDLSKCITWCVDTHWSGSVDFSPGIRRPAIQVKSSVQWKEPTEEPPPAT